MRKVSLKLVIVPCLLLSVIACGETSSGGATSGVAGVTDNNNPTFQSVAALKSEIEGTGGAKFQSIPVSGTASYSGQGSVNIFQNTGENPQAVLKGVGTFNMTANFSEESTNKISGSLTDIRGYHGSAEQVQQQEEASAALQKIDGQLNLNKGFFPKSTQEDSIRTNRFGTSYAGNLTADTYTYSISGRANTAKKDRGTSNTQFKNKEGKPSINYVQIQDADGKATITAGTGDTAKTTTEHRVEIDLYGTKTTQN